MELVWRNNAPVAVNMSENQQSFPKSPKSPSASKSEVKGPLLPPPTPATQLYMGEDEMASWLHYPLGPNSAPVAVNQSQSQQSFLKSSSSSKSGVSSSLLPPPAAPTQLDMAENEMASWLHYPLEPFYSEFLTQNPTTNAPPLPAANLPSYQRAPPQPQFSPSERGFPLFSMMSGSSATEQSSGLGQGLTVVDSNETPITRSSNTVFGPNVVGPKAVVVTSTTPTVTQGLGERMASTTSSSSATNSATAIATLETGGTTTESDLVIRKRKCKEIEESVDATIPSTTPIDPQNEEVGVGSGDEKKHSRGASASKRSRAAEVHNLSERRRRDRINEKMKALQDLIPRCNKSDKASMLDEAIEYVKSMKMQVQMMSAMGCRMVPMMHPGMQQHYMSPTGMGMGMGVMPYAPAIPSPGVPPPPAPNVMPPLAPGLPIPPYVGVPPVPPPHLTVNQPSNSADLRSTPYATQSTGTSQIPNMADPYQQYLAFQQMHMQMQMQMHLQAVQGQTLSQPSSSKPSQSKREGDNEDDAK